MLTVVTIMKTITSNISYKLLRKFIDNSDSYHGIDSNYYQYNCSDDSNEYCNNGDSTYYND